MKEFEKYLIRGAGTTAGTVAIVVLAAWLLPQVGISLPMIGAQVAPAAPADQGTLTTAGTQVAGWTCGA